MSIQDLSAKFKGTIQNSEYQLTALVVVVALASFMFGRLSEGEESRLFLDTEVTDVATAGTSETKSQETQEQAVLPSDSGGYVASKNGTKYHLPWCGSAKSIKEENKIWFATKAEAEKAGYTPAANCKGI